MPVVNGATARFSFDEQAFQQFIRRVGDKGVDEARKLLTEKAYPPASAPGGVPASRTGALANSFRSLRVKNAVRVMSTSSYGDFLEKGTKKMAARPFMKELIKRTRKAALGMKRPKMVKLT